MKTAMTDWAVPMNRARSRTGKRSTTIGRHGGDLPHMDLGDAWEHSDEPEYQEKWASLAYRIAMNYFVYDLSH